VHPPFQGLHYQFSSSSGRHHLGLGLDRMP
jgi:hypothetical protein